MTTTISNSWCIAESGLPQATLVEKMIAEGKTLGPVAYDESRQEELRVVGGVAVVTVAGMLLRHSSPRLARWGIVHAGYDSIESAVEEANARADVSRIELHIDSPGGHVHGLTRCADIIAASKKPTCAIVDGMCASAAYVLASQCGEIVAKSRGDIVGSVGVFVRAWTDPEGAVVTVRNTDSPKKAPDVATEQGRGHVRERLDADFAQMVELIASGRSKSAAIVIDTFGQGASMLASEAVGLGMIDSLQVACSDPQASDRACDMNAKELQAQYPEACAEIVQQASEQATADERGRVMKHITFGKTAEALPHALELIESGAKADGEAAFSFMEAKMAKDKEAARASEQPPEIDASATQDEAVNPFASAVERAVAGRGLSLE